MGWKAFKEHFKIEHIVAIEKKGLCIGSGYCHDLIVINLTTGELFCNPTFNLIQRYPALLEATPAELLALLQQPDEFTASIPVYTFEDAQIFEKYCEELGWPNVTHDGCIMYENVFFADREKAVRKALACALSSVKYAKTYVERAEKELVEKQVYLQEQETIWREIQAAYPEQAKTVIYNNKDD